MANNKKPKLKIAQIAPIWYSLPPAKYAGIERIVSPLAEELVKRGHEVTLFASGNSKTSAKLISIRDRALAEDKIPWNDTFWELENLSYAFRHAGNFDIVHSHVGLRALFFQDFVNTPVIHTFHNPVYRIEGKNASGLDILELHKNTTRACFVSKAAERICPVRIKESRVVYNGIDTDFFKFNSDAENYFLWAGRVEPYKGVENAISAAEKVGATLYLVGKVDPGREEYFNGRIKPHLSDRIKYLGELSQKDIADVYARAKALVYPIEWHEPFGLIMAEAQACGTPVIVFDMGSAREVVEDGKTGFVVPFLDKNGNKNINGIVEAMNNAGSIKREDCRKWVEDNFTLGKMVDNYEKIYNEIGNGN